MKEKYFLLAKRWNNAKRQYLLVNPLQAKHIPVSPTQALEMMEKLGEEVKNCCKDVRLVIGFAETATAIGAVVASKFSKCVYLQTTRENVPNAGQSIDFSEEHSHAVEQRLYVAKMRDALAKTQAVAFVDDEISTGKTMVNMLEQLECVFPELKEKRKILASIVNRVSEENEKALVKAGFTCVQLTKIPNENYTPYVASYIVEAPCLARENEHVFSVQTEIVGRSLDPRTGVEIETYFDECERIGREIAEKYPMRGEKVVVIGTEECMLPALILGKVIERTEPSAQVFTHSTTRSPICVSKEKGYPIQNGKIIHSFYEEDRTNYLYNFDKYDWVIVLSDTRNWNERAERDVQNGFAEFGCDRFLSVKGAFDV